MIDLADVGEVRRRVVDPVLADLLRPGELVGAELVADHDWPRDPDDPWPDWMDSPFSTRPGDAPKSLFLVVRGGRDGGRTIRLGELGFFRAEVVIVAERIAESLSDGVAGSVSGRAQARALGPDLTFPPAVTQVDGRPVVVLDWDADAQPVLDVGGTSTTPSSLSLSRDLVTDLGAWSAALDQDLQVVFSALDRAQQARFNAEFVGRPPGLRSVMFPRKKAAAARKRADEALAQAHLGRWSRLVAEHEPRRDHLVERLRAELGPGFHVPTPARIP